MINFQSFLPFPIHSLFCRLERVLSQVFLDRILVQTVAVDGQLRISIVQGLPFVEEFAKSLILGLGNAASCKVADAALNLTKRDL